MPQRKKLTMSQMNPSAYAALYGPYQQPRRSRRGRNVVALLAAVVWAVTLASLGWLTLLVGMAAVWGAAEGAPVGGVLLRFVLIVVGAAAALTAAAFAPGIRRMALAGRALIVGALAAPVPAGLAVYTWIHVG
ncbi:hypothetical protein ACFV7R_10925 [Streptomyces sp. NPDC059866]|uniref:hypothetical protein n=1 Tax=Streptomyces sp. NPDC059866 TaxID=3346978 RepID=UPI00365E759D